MIFLTRGDRIFILERASGEFHDENSVPECKKYHTLAHKQAIGNGHWESNFFNGYFSPIVVKIQFQHVLRPKMESSLSKKVVTGLLSLG